jgi:holo-[acyl-carrier protein] synthase
MAVMSIGSDLQSLAHLREKKDLFGNRAVFTPYEREYCAKKRDAWSTLGGLLCAKEACIKALSPLSPPRVTFHDLEIRHRPDGGPMLVPGARLAPWLGERDLAFHLSISHSGDYAMATAIVSSSSSSTSP